MPRLKNPLKERVFFFKLGKTCNEVDKMVWLFIKRENIVALGLP